ncbi:MAG TPA: sigma-70 family RNA polymerase sigma factor [Pirellulales bacterium]|nr:sigma-70 family RNA polymerase sigma factor [Pirellulales bacterium]
MRSEPVRSSRSFRSLFKAAAGGSSEAVGQLLETCRTYLALIAAEELERDLRVKIAPSDLVQETFVVAQREFARFDGNERDALMAWLRGILLNKLQEARRRFRARKRQIQREVPLNGMKSTARQMRERASRAQSPSRHAAAREEADRISRALSGLSPDYQLVIQLRNWKLLSFVEIGRQMGRTTGAARALWVRALEQLSKALESRDGK